MTEIEKTAQEFREDIASALELVDPTLDALITQYREENGVVAPMLAAICSHIGNYIATIEDFPGSVTRADILECALTQICMAFRATSEARAGGKPN